LNIYERSTCHRNAFRLWKEASSRVTQRTGVDAALQAMIPKQTIVGRLYLRFVSCIESLGLQNSGLRGHREGILISNE